MHGSVLVLNADLPTVHKWKVVVETLPLPTKRGKLQFYLLLRSKLLLLTPPPPSNTANAHLLCICIWPTAHPTPFLPSVLSSKENSCTSSAHQRSFAVLLIRLR